MGDILLGRYTSGLEHLGKLGENGLAQFFRAASPRATSRSGRKPAKAFQAASTAGGTIPRTPASTARPGAAPVGPGMLRRLGRWLEAWRRPGASSAEFHCQQGSLLAAEGELVAATASELEKAIEIDRHHTNALFEHENYINDLHGNDDVALDFYKRLRQAPRRFPSPP